MHLPIDVTKCDKVHVPGSASSDAVSSVRNGTVHVRHDHHFIFIWCCAGADPTLFSAQAHLETILHVHILSLSHAAVFRGRLKVRHSWWNSQLFPARLFSHCLQKHHAEPHSVGTHQGYTPALVILTVDCP